MPAQRVPYIATSPVALGFDFDLRNTCLLTGFRNRIRDQNKSLSSEDALFACPQKLSVSNPDATDNNVLHLMYNSPVPKMCIGHILSRGRLGHLSQWRSHVLMNTVIFRPFLWYDWSIYFTVQIVNILQYKRGQSPLLENVKLQIYRRVRL